MNHQSTNLQNSINGNIKSNGINGTEASVPIPNPNRTRKDLNRIEKTKLDDKIEKERIYPQIPIAKNGVQSVSLSLLIQSLASTAANFLLNFQDTVGNPNKSEEQKNDIIVKEMKNLLELQEKFLKLYILIKFVTKINYNELIELRQELSQVQELAYSFEFSANSLVYVSDLVKRMKEAHWNIAVASHVLVEGKFEMLPKCLEADSFGLDSDITQNSTFEMNIEDENEENPKSVLFISQLEREKHDMQKLVHDHLLLYLLGTKIPPQMIVNEIKDGIISVIVPGEFKAKLTLSTRKQLKMPQEVNLENSNMKNDDNCLQILKFKLLTNQSDALVSPLDAPTTNRLAKLLQTRIDLQLHPHPLVDIYETVHRVALRLAVDILYQQALQLSKGRFSNYITVDHIYDESSLNLRILVGYWIGAPSMKYLEDDSELSSQNREFQNKFSFTQFSREGYKSDTPLKYDYLPSGQITVFVDTSKGCLSIEHQPWELQCSIALGKFLADQASDLSNLKFSSILMTCLKMHSQERLSTMKKYIEKETEFSCQLSEGCLLISLFEQYSLSILINWQTGKFQFEILFAEQLIFPEDSNSDSLVYGAESDPYLSVKKFEDSVNNHPELITTVLFDIQSNCILYSFASAAHLLEMETFQRSFYETLKSKIADVHTNQLLRDSNGMYIVFPNYGKKNHIFVSNELIEEDVNGKIMKKIKTTLSLLLFDEETYILLTPPKQGRIASSNFRSQFHSPITKRRKLDDYEFNSTLEYLRQFVKDHSITVVRHFLYQGIITLRQVFQETKEAGVVSLPYLFDDDGLDHSKCRIYIRVTEPDSWSAEIRCAHPSIFPSMKVVRGEKFETIHSREKKTKIEIIEHEPEDDSPSTHSIYLHYNLMEGPIISFYSDLRMLHEMGYLARQLEELKLKPNLFPNMKFTILKSYYSGIIISYQPKLPNGTYTNEIYYARIRFDNVFKVILAPSHEMHTFIEYDLKQNQDMSRFLRLLECTSIPMIQLHEKLTQPRDHWIIIPRNLGQARIEYRKRGIIYDLHFTKDKFRVKELVDQTPSNINFPVFEDCKPPCEASKIIQRMCEHAQSKYITLFMEKRLSNECNCDYRNNVLIIETKNLVLRFNLDLETCKIQFNIDCPNEIPSESLNEIEKSALRNTFQQLYERNDFLDFRASLDAFCFLILVPFPKLKAILEYVRYPQDRLTSGQNYCKILLQVPRNLQLPNMLDQCLKQTPSWKNKYTFESAWYREKSRVHMLFRFINSNDFSNYVDIPLTLNTNTEEVAFKFFDTTTDKNIGNDILSYSLPSPSSQDQQLSQVIEICSRKSIIELKKSL